MSIRGSEGLYVETEHDDDASVDVGRFAMDGRERQTTPKRWDKR